MPPIEGAAHHRGRTPEVAATGKESYTGQHPQELKQAAD
jgi:hypothetical protein